MRLRRAGGVGRLAAPLPRGARAWRAVAAAVWLVLVGLELVALGVGHVGDDVLGASRNLIFPGLGFVEWHWWAAARAAAAGAVALACWFSWGADWLVAVVWAAAAAAAWRLVPPTHHHAVSSARLRTSASSHEFAAVMALLAALRWVRAWTIDRPTVRRLLRRGRSPSSVAVGVVDRARAAAVWGLTARAGLAAPAIDPDLVQDLTRRARRVSRLARWRWRGDPLRADHAAARAALALNDLLDEERLTALRADAERSWCGVPASEPTWVRPLDAVLAAAALHDAGAIDAARRWCRVAETRFALRHGRRPAWVHRPSAIGGGAALWWEHAAFAALSGVFGWLTDDLDWAVLRPRCLGAAARGGRAAQHARLVAAGRILAARHGDEPARAILARPTIGPDPLAAALDAIGRAVATEPTRFQRPNGVAGSSSRPRY